MKLSPEIKLLRKAIKTLEDYMYPGYPFTIQGIVDLKNDVGYIDNSTAMAMDKFIHELHAELCYHLIGNTQSTKGTWLQNVEMQEYKKYLDADYEDFYVDNVEVAKLYFALSSAIREYRHKDAIIFWGYDGDSGMPWVEVFLEDEKGSKESKIRKYLEDYYEIK